MSVGRPVLSSSATCVTEACFAAAALAWCSASSSRIRAASSASACASRESGGGLEAMPFSPEDGGIVVALVGPAGVGGLLQNGI